MRANWILGTAVVAMSVTVTVAAKATTGRERSSQVDATSMTFTGCVASANHGGTFLLTKVDSAAADSMHGDMAMKHHDAAAMKGDAARSMAHDQMPVADENMDMMPSKSFVLAGTANLSKHIGHRVSVTGSVSEGAMGMLRQDVSTLTIKTLKVIAKSCS